MMGMPSAAMAAMTEGDNVNHVLCTCAMSMESPRAMRRTVRALQGFHGAIASVMALDTGSVGLTG